MRKLLTPFFVLFLVTGCMSTQILSEAETPEQKYWAALSIFDVYDASALSLAQDPATPVSVQQTLKKVRAVAKAALVLADEGYNAVQSARMQLDLNPDATSLDVLTVALQAFNDRAENAFIKVRAFRDTVDDFQE